MRYTLKDYQEDAVADVLERLWHSLKQEEVYRHAYETVAEAEKRIADYLRYFNEERPQQGLDNRTPDDVFFERKPLAKAA